MRGYFLKDDDCQTLVEMDDERDQNIVAESKEHRFAGKPTKVPHYCGQNKELENRPSHNPDSSFVVILSIQKWAHANLDEKKKVEIGLETCWSDSYKNLQP
mmetsp:Transcript_34427/g.39010  ORF Transcript_34427/g.39010 Transcript_34427/m.39010 type:complete len:101 (-) Transcript_34427:166-468(-)